MPYFIYRVFAFRRLERVEAFASFGEASARAKALRASADLAPDCTVKVIFAANELEAEDLLSQVREKSPGIADDE
jgi:acylphosphatase